MSTHVFSLHAFTADYVWSQRCISCWTQLIFVGLITLGNPENSCGKSRLPWHVRSVERGPVLKLFCPTGLRPLEVTKNGIISPSKGRFARYICLYGEYQRVLPSGIEQTEFFCADEEPDKCPLLKSIEPNVSLTNYQVAARVMFALNKTFVILYCANGTWYTLHRSALPESILVMHNEDGNSIFRDKIAGAETNARSQSLLRFRQKSSEDPVEITTNADQNFVDHLTRFSSVTNVQTTNYQTERKILNELVPEIPVALQHMKPILYSTAFEMSTVNNTMKVNVKLCHVRDRYLIVFFILLMFVVISIVAFVCACIKHKQAILIVQMKLLRSAVD